MSTDWKALCAELAQQLDDALDFTVSSETRRYMKELTGRARAALAAEADGPAVPEGREPASVVGEPSDEELKAAYWEAYRETAMCGAEASWLAGLRAVAGLGRPTATPAGQEEA